MKRSFPGMITFVTGNKKKLEEVRAIFAGHPLAEKLDNKKVDLPELQGEPDEIAAEKCRLAAKEVSCCDDERRLTGLARCDRWVVR